MSETYTQIRYVLLLCPDSYTVYIYHYINTRQKIQLSPKIKHNSFSHICFSSYTISKSLPDRAFHDTTGPPATPPRIWAHPSRALRQAWRQAEQKHQFAFLKYLWKTYFRKNRPVLVPVKIFAVLGEEPIPRQASYLAPQHYFWLTYKHHGRLGRPAIQMIFRSIRAAGSSNFKNKPTTKPKPRTYIFIKADVLAT